ncbi:MAG TPA: TolC family protein [Saprospiraceae bacterium]|nr:TolC family protein [Saprospiraceae bacterium]
MKKYIILSLILFLLPLFLVAQSNVEIILSEVAKNNKSLYANSTFWEEKKLEYQVGLTPYNPKVDYDFLIGSPSAAGNQSDFTINQSFDFPTVYQRKRQLANEQMKTAEYKMAAAKKQILFEAQKIYIEQIYHNKLNSVLTTRKLNTEQLLGDFQKKLDKGEGTILDVQKTRLQLIEISTQLQENNLQINQLKQKLIALNGGIEINNTDTLYLIQAQIPDIEKLIKEIASMDAQRQAIEQQKIVSNQEVMLAKALMLPKFEAGYHYQAILGQRFNGAHVGLTLPLWENRNTVKTKQAGVALQDAYLQDYIHNLNSKIKQEYEQMETLKTSLQEYQSLFNSLNNTDLLKKAFTLGQLSSIEYFLELNYYYNALHQYYKIERDYYISTCNLLKHRL